MRIQSSIVLLCLLSLSGCSLVRDLVGKTTRSLGPEPEIVVPPSLLEGRAARLQDSLRPRLEWLVSHPPKGWNASLVSFRHDGDTTAPVFLLIETTERVPLNAHRKEPRDLARIEGRRILSLSPWRREVAESKLSEHPASLRVLYRHRDYLLSSSRFVEDTILVRYADSSAIWKGAPLDL